MRRESHAPIALPQRNGHAPSQYPIMPAAASSLHDLATAFEESPAAIILTDPAGVILYANAAFAEMTGFGNDELVGVPAASLRGTSPEPGDPWPAPSGGHTWAGRSWNRRKNGEFYWALVNISPIRDAAGAVTAYIAIHQELEAVASAPDDDASPETAARLTHTSPEFVLILDTDGTIRFINTTVPGLNRDHVIGSSVYEFVPPDQLETLRTHIERVLAGGEPSTYEIIAVAAHGTAAPYVTHVGPFKHNGEIVALILASNPLEPSELDHDGAPIPVRPTAVTALRAGRRRTRPSKLSPSRSAGRRRGRRVDLTDRELGVLTLLGQGLTNRQVAGRLELSQRTIDHHVSHILTKLRVPNRTAAVIAAEQNGMLKVRNIRR